MYGNTGMKKINFIFILVTAIIIAVQTPACAKILPDTIFSLPEIFRENNIITIKYKENPPENIDSQRYVALKLIKPYLKRNILKASVIWQKDEFSYGKIASIANIYIRDYLEKKIDSKKIADYFVLETIEPIFISKSNNNNDIGLIRPDFLALFSENSKKAEELRQKADIYRLNALYDNAIRIYLDVISFNPEDAISHYWLGTIYLKQKNYDQAREHLVMAIKIDPKFIAANNALLELDKGN